MNISKKSCTRVDLAGGTLDCWPLYLLVDGCVTVNLSISIQTHVNLRGRPDSIVEVNIRDLKYTRTFRNADELVACQDPQLRLVQRHVAFWRPTMGFVLETHSESPIGGGLGGSSSLSISLIKAFSQWLNQPLDLYESVVLSHNLEAQVLHKMTGTQDYFPALQPGLNAIHYTPRGPRLESMSASADFWNARLTLVYIGEPHHSGLNNWQVIKASLEQDRETLRALRDLKGVADDLYAALKGGHFDDLTTLFKREFEARVRLSSSFSSPRIERLREVALKGGASAVKICGAGGGGCVLVWSRPDKKDQVEAACREHGFEVLTAKAVV